MKLRNPLIPCVVVAALLAACGGGGDDGSVEDTAVPAAAADTPAAYTDFAVAQAATPSESAEPLSLDNLAMPPTSETAYRR